MLNKSFRAAFTIVELLLVVMIVALSSTYVAFEIYSSIQQTSLRAESQRLLQTARYARVIALREHVTCRLHIDLTGRTYRLSVIPTDIPVDKNHEPVSPVIVADSMSSPHILAEELRFKRAQAGPGLAYQGSEVVIKFYPDGTADASFVQIFGKNDAVCSILVFPATGRAEMRNAAVNELPVDSVKVSG